MDESWWSKPSKVAADQRLKGATRTLIEQALADTLAHAVLIN